MRHKKDDVAEQAATARRVSEAVNKLSRKESDEIIEQARNTTFNEMTAKLRSMDPIALKGPRMSQAEFKSLVDFSALLYAYLLLCEKTVGELRGLPTNVALQVFKF